ncbi:MAG: hypothetical protein LC637_02770 [Xanthomonadaceae bacterium]|nr:hypothetical protein [Xanthomonadaceae bacterium]
MLAGEGSKLLDYFPWLTPEQSEDFPNETREFSVSSVWANSFNTCWQCANSSGTFNSDPKPAFFYSR